MTVRIPQSLVALDNRRLAAILTPALLSPANDDSPEARVQRAGTAWLRWGDANLLVGLHLS